MARSGRNYSAENARRNAAAQSRGFGSYYQERKARQEFQSSRSNPLTRDRVQQLREYKAEALAHAQSSRAFNPSKEQLSKPEMLELFNEMVNDPRSPAALEYWCAEYGFDDVQDWEDFRERYDAMNA